VATECLLKRLHDFTIEPDAVIEYRMGESRGPTNVPVNCSARK
jgi:hypothetical protein